MKFSSGFVVDLINRLQNVRGIGNGGRRGDAYVSSFNAMDEYMLKLSQKYAAFRSAYISFTSSAFT